MSRSGSASQAPTLCVVGHPNRGKSSIVSTLTENDSVRISPASGTTRRADRFEFSLNGRVLLTLVDTPGFQRARQVLAWLEREPISPGERPNRVRAFLAEPGHADRFPDEVELLRPIMDGAGILYVVDGAQAPSAMDEAEMEILRWTGQPRLAVINPMAPQSQTGTWQRTLGQFFQWVRVFNPLTATLPARQALLRAVGELTPDWSAPIQRLIQGLAARDQQRLTDVSDALAAYWAEQLLERQPVQVPGAIGRQRAEEQLRRALDERETDFFRQLREAWGHRASELARDGNWELDTDQLMNTETWYLWGLKQRELLWVSGSAGVATGLVVDAGLGGASLLTGAISGGVIGSMGGWLASRELPGKRLGWLPLTRQRQVMGPVKHPNFPLVVMARALTFTRQLWLKPHAERSAVVLRSEAGTWPREEQVQLLGWAKRLQQGRWQARHQDALVHWVEHQLRVSLDEAFSREEKTSWV
ncbi:GTPase/DUF3482 domain-containing protein [Marinimicrobium sp. C6131]|uniref:GTPase/DUF3482 domain-containing protein n=1 Tax=Marinimicrobium sp. C6131 TaxID=3022676 RepID=UPI00223C90B9|nr:GTPase/DUF3482 domain-containing protein [Marinimicrobium sp. C6131]UZJ45707.1 GTPase/DUF3482 domain-containing protein [Marinimicrobium sp. C6131]